MTPGFHRHAATRCPSISARAHRWCCARSRFHRRWRHSHWRCARAWSRSVPGVLETDHVRSGPAPPDNACAHCPAANPFARPSGRPPWGRGRTVAQRPEKPAPPARRMQPDQRSSARHWPVHQRCQPCVSAILSACVIFLYSIAYYRLSRLTVNGASRNRRRRIVRTSPINRLFNSRSGHSDNFRPASGFNTYQLRKLRGCIGHYIRAATGRLRHDEANRCIGVRLRVQRAG